MKIAWLAPYPAPHLGDKVAWAVKRTSGHPCSWIINLSKALVNIPDIELHLLTICPWVSCTQTIEQNGVSVHLIQVGIPMVHRGWPAWFPLDAISGFWREVGRMHAELSCIGPDIVHAHGTEKGYALAAMGSGYPYLVSMQGILSEISKTNPCFYYRSMVPRERRVVQNSRFFSCRTHFDTGFVRTLNKKAEIFDIPEAMNPVFWNGEWRRNDDNRILFVGGGVPLKGLHTLIEAVSLVVNPIPSVSIDAVGACSPERQEELTSLARDRSVQIRFHGFRPAEEIANFHRKCAVFVLASANENSPNTLAEAMVSGMPCVAFNVGGVSSMVDDGKTGLLVSPGDVEGLASAIVKLLGSPDLAEHLGHAAAEVARVRHRPEFVADLTLAAYREILAAEGR